MIKKYTPFTHATILPMLYLGIVALCLIGGLSVLSAQTTNETTAQNQQEGGINNRDLNLGEVVAPRIGVSYLRETHGDWQIRCITVEQGAEPCQMYQLLRSGDGQPTLEMSIFTVPQQNNNVVVAGATVITPLETLLTEGLQIQIDGKPSKKYPFGWCSAAGCYAQIGLTIEDIENFEKSKSAKFIIYPFVAPDTEIVLTLSLQGFTAGFKALSNLTQPE